MLTIIPLALVGIYFKTPTPFTVENINSGKVKMTDMALVRVQGVNVDAEVTGRVQIDQ